ncbi:MAG: glycosyltransferase family 4 protein [bacterium]
MRIFFAAGSAASFVKRDLEILRTRHQVSFHSVRHFNPLRWLADLPQLLGSQLVFFWFASLYNLPYLFAAVLFGKRIVTVVGGYEAGNHPEHSYGQARGGWRTKLTRLMLGASEVVFAVSESSRRELLSNLGIPEEKIVLLHHGFEDLAAGRQFHKQNTVVTVATLARSTWLIKGIRDFCEIAERLPGVDFLLVGEQRCAPEKLWGKPQPANLRTVGQVPYDRLAEYLGPAKVYLQLSRAESFGCAVAEAMLFRAIPVVSAAGALPEVVGSCGSIVPVDDLEAAIRAVKSALAAPESAGEAARQRVLKEFGREARQQKLLQVVEGLTRRRDRQPQSAV